MVAQTQFARARAWRQDTKVEHGWSLDLWWPQGEALRESPGATFPSGAGELMGV
jgi:hypothetical protein